ncbi:MAG: helix-turn-helix transcriptional regulator [Clostridia bacterium]|nr:helix-turn-helix transcriptional regulator [Clostridia bacterium]
MLKITAIRHAWPEKAGFTLDRKNGHPDYTFVHFSNGAQIRFGSELVNVPHHGCILYEPGVPQYIHSPHPLIHDWFHFQGDPAPLLSTTGLPFSTLFYPQRSDFITDIVREMESEFFAQRSGRDELLELKIRELFIRLARAVSGESSAAVDISTSERLRKLRGEIFRSLGYSWTVREMASRVGLSESRFYSVYRSVYGNSPMDDLIRARIDAAKNALSFTDHSVSSIAESLGYSNLTHFIRQFKNFTGISPARFRNYAGE